jgi:hypothetical protein
VATWATQIPGGVVRCASRGNPPQVPWKRYPLAAAGKLTGPLGAAHRAGSRASRGSAGAGELHPASGRQAQADSPRRRSAVILSIMSIMKGPAGAGT